MCLTVIRVSRRLHIRSRPKGHDGPFSHPCVAQTETGENHIPAPVTLEQQGLDGGSLPQFSLVIMVVETFSSGLGSKRERKCVCDREKEKLEERSVKDREIERVCAGERKCVCERERKTRREL